jgi:hypothetical protein
VDEDAPRASLTLVRPPRRPASRAYAEIRSALGMWSLLPPGVEMPAIELTRDAPASFLVLRGEELEAAFIDGRERR